MEGPTLGWAAQDRQATAGPVRDRGLLAALRAFRTGSLVSFGVCGLCTGLAYLTRPEGVLLGLAAGLVLLATYRVAADRWPWRRTLGAGVSLAATALAVSLPYMHII